MGREAGQRVGLRGTLAIVVYLPLCLLPLLVAWVGPLPPGRGFWVEFGVALGFVGAGMMGVQFVLTARFPAFAMTMGQDTLLRFHRVAGMLAVGFTLAHPVVLIAADPGYASFFDPRVNLARAGALSGVTVAIVALVALSALRPRLAMQHEWWRLSHGVLAAFIMLVAVAHVVMVDHYSQPWARKLALVGVIGAPLALFAHVRLVRPWRMRRLAWRVVSVVPEVERVWSVTLEPVGHPGLRFRAGQFAWVAFGPTPFMLRQHPFTIASDARRPDRLVFTIKELGDFTRTIGDVPVSSSAYIEGPAGNFVVPEGVGRVVFVAGGIGITPAVSMVRSLVGGAGPVSFRLLHAAERLEKAAFREELAAAAAGHPWLAVHHILERPPEDWGGESGFVDGAMLERLISEDERRDAVFMICGPVPMMDAVEAALLGMGIERGRIRSERFDLA